MSSRPSSVAPRSCALFQTSSSRVGLLTTRLAAYPNAVAHARLTLLEARWDRDACKARLKLGLLNSGGVTWLHTSMAAGCVTISLFRGGDSDGAGFREAANRVPLPKSVLPGEELVLDAEFLLPGDAAGLWSLGLVCEGCYWFHTKETVPVEVRLA